jgi:hypothetical protein
MAAASMLMTAAPLFAAEKTWNGTISDSMCGMKHASAAEHGSEEGDAECTKGCVEKGAKYVFVANGKVFQISNQDFAALKDNAGHKVALTGEMKGDAITVSKIAPAAKKG